MLVFSKEIDEIINSFINKEPVSHVLVSFYGNKTFEDELIGQADELIRNRHISYFSIKEKGLITIAISFIALSYYDGNLWEYIREKFQKTYWNFYSDQLTDGKIRKILQEFSSYTNYSNQNSAVAIPIIVCGITKFWLPSYFVFCFNIYQKRLLARRDIKSDELEDEFLHVFESLKRGTHLNSDADVISFGKTTYKLSRYTQESLKSGSNLRSLAKIAAKCVEITIKEIDGIEHDVPDFYYDAFCEWKNKFFKTDKDKEKLRKNSRAVSNFSFKLKNDAVYLTTRTRWVDDSIGDPNDITLKLYNGDSLIYQTKDLEIENDEMGAFIIHSKTIRIDEDILGTFSYRIAIHDEVIDDSKQGLYRNLMFFDPKTTEEFFNGKTYNGPAFVISKQTIGIGKLMFSQKDYICTEINIDESKDYLIDGVHYGFKTIKNAELEGKKLEWIRYSPKMNDESFVPFSRVDSVVFETAIDLVSIKCVLDEKTFKDIEFIVLQTTESKLHRVRAIFSKQIEDGYHTLRFVDDKGKTVGEKSFCFIVDSQANQDKSCILTSFLKDGVALSENKSVGLKSDCSIQGIGNSIALFSNLHPFISLDGTYWICKNGRIDANKINKSSPVLYIHSFKLPSIRCYCNDIITQLVVKKLNEEFQYSIDIGFLLSNLNTYGAKQAKLVISIDDNEYSFNIDFLAYIDIENSYFKYDENRKKVIFFYDFDPEKQIILVVKKKIGDYVEKYKCPSRQERVLPNLESFVEYEISLKQKIVTMFSSVEKTIERFSFIYYSKDNILNNIFNIKSLELFGASENEIVDFYDSLTTLKIIGESNSNYRLTIQRNTASVGFYNEYQNIGILRAQTNEEFENGCLWIYVKDRDDELLLYDREKHKIVVDGTSKSLVPIERILIKPKGKRGL